MWHDFKKFKKNEWDGWETMTVSDQPPFILAVSLAVSETLDDLILDGDAQHRATTHLQFVSETPIELSARGK